MSEFYNNSIFWVEVDRISPNPYQPRKEFNDDKIAELADSIRQYGVLQPLVVTRKETEREDGGIAVEYELIAGERRLRASKLAMLPQVPVIIRAQEETNKMKLELAIIENLQREDLNAIDRALAFKQLVDEFDLKHIEVAKKVGKSREYVSNTLRLLGLPKHIQNALVAREITEGHARPLLMLGDDRAQERETLFEEIKDKKLTVRESERIARRIATDKARKQDLSPEFVNIEKQLTEQLGTRVQIEKRSDKGGKVHIDYFSEEDLKRLLDLLAQERAKTPIEQSTISQTTHNTTNEAVEKFNDTFVTPAPVPTPAPITTPEEQYNTDPFKQFEIQPQAQPTTKTPEQSIETLKDPFADLPPLPPLPTESVAPAVPKTAAPASQAPFNPFTEIPEQQTQEEAAMPASVPQNPFADLPSLPKVSENSQAEQPPIATAQSSTPTEPFNPFVMESQPPVSAPQAPKDMTTTTDKQITKEEYDTSIKNFTL